MATKWFAQNVREAPIDTGVKKVLDYLTAKDLLAISFEKGCGFCVMKKLDDVLNSNQIQKINGAKNEIVIKHEKQINNSLQQLMKQGEKSYKICQRLGSTGSQQARLSGLAKVLKKDAPIRPVIWMLGSS